MHASIGLKRQFAFKIKEALLLKWQLICIRHKSRTITPCEQERPRRPQNHLCRSMELYRLLHCGTRKCMITANRLKRFYCGIYHTLWICVNLCMPIISLKYSLYVFFMHCSCNRMKNLYWQHSRKVCGLKINKATVIILNEAHLLTKYFKW